MSADVLEHFLGSGTAPGIKDLHTAPQTTPTKDCEDTGLWHDQKLSHGDGGIESVSQTPAANHQAEKCILCIHTSHLRPALSILSPALLGEPKQPHLEDPIKTQNPRKLDFKHHESGSPQPSLVSLQREHISYQASSTFCDSQSCFHWHCSSISMSKRF